MTLNFLYDNIAADKIINFLHIKKHFAAILSLLVTRRGLELDAKAACNAEKVFLLKVLEVLERVEAAI